MENITNSGADIAPPIGQDGPLGDSALGPAGSRSGGFSSPEFERDFHFEGQLGAIYSGNSTTFRLWAPTAAQVDLLLFPAGSGGGPDTALPMDGRERGCWERTLPGDLHGRFYAYAVTVGGTRRVAVDPYARAVGLNGERGMVIDLARANPDLWQGCASPALASPAEAVVYELHVRDMTSCADWGGPRGLRCSYLGVAQRETRLPGNPGVSTGLDHVKELGVTHVQVMPFFDFASVDESRAREPGYASREYGGAFNWGYDPQNYNAPEGSYSLDPADGCARVRELKRMIMAFNGEGIGVVMDVVYNHMPDRSRSCLEACVPGYYFRPTSDSGAGSDTASERSMMRKFIVDSALYWLAEYKLSGFRVDLMGLHDLKTVNALSRALRSAKPDILLYGEGWSMYSGKAMVPASMKNIGRLPGVGMFNDAFRCAIKGSIFSPAASGWIHDGSRQESVKFGLVGAVRHPQVRNKAVEGTARPGPWTEFGWQSVSYVEVHDDLTLADKLSLVEPGADPERRLALARMAISLVLLSQGMPLLHAGMEFLRSKELPQEWLRSGLAREAVSLPDGSRAFSRNSYSASDRVNGIRWADKAARAEFCRYVSNLIRLRKEHQAFRLASGREIRRRLRFVNEAGGLLAFTLDMDGTADPWARVLVAANAAEGSARLCLGDGAAWRLVSDGAAIDPDAQKACPDGAFIIPPKSVMVFCVKREPRDGPA